MTPRFTGYVLAVLFSVAVHAIWISAAVALFQPEGTVDEFVSSVPEVPLG